MEHLGKRFQQVPENLPKQICFVGDKPQNEGLENSKIFRLPISEMDPNNNFFTPVPGTMYVLNEFENNPLFETIEKDPHTWIVGKTAFNEMCLDPCLEIRSKPTYCTSMYGLCFYINCPGKISLMNRMVCLIKWMGGMFVKEPNIHTTHMISDNSLAKGYTYCSTFRVPIMTPDWIESCWRKRHDIGFKALELKVGYELRPFTALSICLEGFSPVESLDLEFKIKSNGGKVSHCYDSCTHMVIHSSVNDASIADIPPHIPFIVNDDWLYSSLYHGERGYEEYYSCLQVSSLEEIQIQLDESDYDEYYSSDAVEDLPKSTSLKSLPTRSSCSLNFENCKRQDARRKFAFEELCQTEQNYIQCLRRLITAKLQASEAQDGPILTPTEEKIIFSNIEGLLDLHEILLEQLDQLLNNWQNDLQIGKIFIEKEGQFMKQYSIYTNNFDASKKCLRQCLINNVRFQQLMKSLQITREVIDDLFIRPIQRLCRVVLLLQEIIKNTRDDNPDKDSLKEAITALKQVLGFIDNDKAQLNKYEFCFNIHNFIEHCPADLISSNRDFIVEFSAQEVVDKSSTLGPLVEFFVFSDVLEITKTKSKSIGFPRGVDVEERQKFKPYKHIAMLSLSMVLHVVTDAKDIFGFNIRDVNNEKNNKLYCFKYLDEEDVLDDILMKIAALLSSQRDCSKAPEDFIIKSPSIGRLSVDPIYSHKENNPAVGMMKTASKLVNSLLFRKRKQQKRKSSSCSDISSLLKTYEL